MGSPWNFSDIVVPTCDDSMSSFIAATLITGKTLAVRVRGSGMATKPGFFHLPDVWKELGRLVVQRMEVSVINSECEKKRDAMVREMVQRHGGKALKRLRRLRGRFGGAVVSDSLFPANRKFTRPHSCDQDWSTCRPHGCHCGNNQHRTIRHLRTFPGDHRRSYCTTSVPCQSYPYRYLPLTFLTVPTLPRNAGSGTVKKYVKNVSKWESRNGNHLHAQ